MPQKLLVANLFEYALIGVGWLLLWRLQFSPKAREARRTTPLPAPESATRGVNALVGMLWLFLTASLFSSYASLGFVAGAVFAILALQLEPAFGSAQRFSPTHPKEKTSLAAASLVTFLVVVAVVVAVQSVWEYMLVRAGLPTGHQALIDVFKNAKTARELAPLIFNAVIIAPITEELFFRAGLFRFLRGRVNSTLTLLLPSLIFAALHVDRTDLKGLVTFAPLTALGIVFSLAFERTGRISVPIVAHALFNLHTIVFLLLSLAP